MAESKCVLVLLVAMLAAACGQPSNDAAQEPEESVLADPALRAIDAAKQAEAEARARKDELDAAMEAAEGIDEGDP